MSGTRRSLEEQAEYYAKKLKESREKIAKEKNRKRAILQKDIEHMKFILGGMVVAEDKAKEYLDKLKAQKNARQQDIDGIAKGIKAIEELERADKH